MTALDSLSEYCGIVPSFVDARGDTQTATQATRQALLAAMGIHATDEESARSAEASLRAKEASQCLPPVHVHYQGSGPIEIAIHSDPALPLHWRIELEEGGTLQGPVSPAPSPPPASGGASAPARRLRIQEDLPCGYHTLTLGTAEARCSLIVSPGACWLPAGVDEGRQFWGVAAQLYLLRSETNWGIGDYGDLQRLVKLLAARGADVVGLNPLHAMFPDDPEQASPYSPASRLLLNILNIDAARVADSTSARPRKSSWSLRNFSKHWRVVVTPGYWITRVSLPLSCRSWKHCLSAAIAQRRTGSRFLHFERRQAPHSSAVVYSSPCGGSSRHSHPGSPIGTGGRKSIAARIQLRLTDLRKNSRTP